MLVAYYNSLKKGVYLVYFIDQRLNRLRLKTYIKTYVWMVNPGDNVKGEHLYYY
jgi:hypothetical protein